jgi:DNA-binding NtrC family response regulator
MRPQLQREAGEGASVLLIRDGADYWCKLKAALESQLLRVSEVRGLREAEVWLKAPNPPQLVFTAVLLADGDWERVLLLGKTAGVPVIVVSTCLDVSFCLDVLERGAFDFIVPPIDQDDVAYVVRNASWRVVPAARRSLSRAA